MSETISIFCVNKQESREFPRGISLIEVYEGFGSPLGSFPMNAKVNNKVEGLSMRCYYPIDVEFVDYTKESGVRTYLRSLCHILAKSVHDINPNLVLYLQHPISKGYFCTIENGSPITEEQLAQIEERMRYLIGLDLPFVRHVLRTDDVTKFLGDISKMKDRIDLIKTSGNIYTTFYELDGYYNYFYGCLVPSTGFIKNFGLEKYENGFLLRIPKRENMDELQPVISQNKLFAAYNQYLEFQKALKVEYVGDLNQSIREKTVKDLVMVAEAMQEKQVASIATQIAQKNASDGVRLVLISGPSSSGKTTFCKRLKVQLKTNLIHPVSISLDNYFKNRKDTPLDDSGAYDFESLYALDLELFNKDMQRLLDGEEILLPSFNFITGEREYNGKKLRLNPDSILVVEGIHALNPELSKMISDRVKFKIYVSALTTISLDRHNWIPTSDNRLIRRIVRDYQYRGYSAADTISRWSSVRSGEEKWIFPYQENADVMFNSAMIYELAALRKYAEPILREVLQNQPEYAEAYRLLKFLSYFNYMSENDLPSTSLLREFLGGSSFRY